MKLRTFKTSIRTDNKYTPSNLTKAIKILQINGIDGSINNTQVKYLRSFVNSWIKDQLVLVNGFDGKLFNKSGLIEIYGSCYIQAITSNNDSSWCWESIDFKHYIDFSKIINEGITKFIQDKLKDKKLWFNLYLFNLKNRLTNKFDYWYTQEDVKELFDERIRDDIDAYRNTLYQEGYENEYLGNKFNSRIHKEEYLYELLEEAQEEYYDSWQSKEDLDEATTEITDQWLNYLDNDELLYSVLKTFIEEDKQ